jgi:hypothetical protein
MKYFLDTEFHEYKKKDTDTIELISIGIVDENRREYYAVCNEFDLKAAWNSFQIKQVHGGMKNKFPNGIKEYWLRENVLKQIFNELQQKELVKEYRANQCSCSLGIKSKKFTYRNFKKFIKKYGKSKKQIANEIKEFCIGDAFDVKRLVEETNPEFYAYYADYDWVVFCWLFGRMIDLPKGFPMYCKNLKQIMDERGYDKDWKRKYCPDPIIEHNALVDATWNLSLFSKMKL